MPAINVVENKKEFRIQIAAPGLTKDDFKIRVERNRLDISVHRETKHEEKDGNEQYLRQEFGYTSFTRSFILPDGVDTGQVSATQKNGVIEITLPKKAEAPENKVKEIEIK